jgi:hypothetical protein
LRRVIAHTGRRVEPWDVSCAVMATPDRKKPPLVVVTMSDASDRHFAVSGGMIAEAGRGFPALLRKISRYDQRSLRAIRGAAYDFADLAVRVGLSFDKGAPAGVVVEIEYRPCAVATECANLVGELMDKISAPLVPPPHATQDPSANSASTTLYAYKRVDADIAKLLPNEPPSFSHRHAAALYAKLLS